MGFHYTLDCEHTSELFGVCCDGLCLANTGRLQLTSLAPLIPMLIPTFTYNLILIEQANKQTEPGHNGEEFAGVSGNYLALWSRSFFLRLY